MDMMTKWDGVRITRLDGEAKEQTFTGEPVEVRAEVALGGLRPEDVSVEIYSGPLDQSGQFTERSVTLMRHEKPLDDGAHLYKGEVIPDEPGRFGLTLRVLPCHPLLLDAHSLGLIRWAEE
jgi:starch phosphorylase